MTDGSNIVGPFPIWGPWHCFGSGVASCMAFSHSRLRLRFMAFRAEQVSTAGWESSHISGCYRWRSHCTSAFSPFADLRYLQVGHGGNPNLTDHRDQRVVLYHPILHVPCVYHYGEKLGYGVVENWDQLYISNFLEVPHPDLNQCEGICQQNQVLELVFHGALQDCLMHLSSCLQQQREQHWSAKGRVEQHLRQRLLQQLITVMTIFLKVVKWSCACWCCNWRWPEVCE